MIDLNLPDYCPPPHRHRNSIELALVGKTALATSECHKIIDRHQEDNEEIDNNNQQTILTELRSKLAHENEQYIVAQQESQGRTNKLTVNQYKTIDNWSSSATSKKRKRQVTDSISLENTKISSSDYLSSHKSQSDQQQDSYLQHLNPESPFKTYRSQLDSDNRHQTPSNGAQVAYCWPPATVDSVVVGSASARTGDRSAGSQHWTVCGGSGGGCGCGKCNSDFEQPTKLAQSVYSPHDQTQLALATSGSYGGYQVYAGDDATERASSVSSLNQQQAIAPNSSNGASSVGGGGSASTGNEYNQLR